MLFFWTFYSLKNPEMSNDAENSALHHINYTLQYIAIENSCLIFHNITVV